MPTCDAPNLCIGRKPCNLIRNNHLRHSRLGKNISAYCGRVGFCLASVLPSKCHSYDCALDVVGFIVRDDRILPDSFLLFFANSRNVLEYLCRNTDSIFQYVKGKGIPLEASTDPEDSRRLRLPNYKTIWHMKVVRLSALRPGRLPPAKEIFLVLISVRG